MSRHAIWTDFRGVLTPPLRDGLHAYCEGKPFTPEQLGQCLRALADRHGCPDGMAVLDSGILDERQWAGEIERELAARFGIEADLANLGAEWWSDRRIDAEWVAALRGWREAGVFVGMISNLPADWRDHFGDFQAWAGMFDEVLLSCDLGTRKPEAAMFRLAEARSGLPPEANVLVDDLDDNVAGARRAGWTGVVGGGRSTRAAITRIEAFLQDGGTRAAAGPNDTAAADTHEGATG
ncbi:HAD-IA family hydrolase [Streptacidiphilus melanogenes]|uniref:HAD-IA family hydrolase n=1 Tax=Streptacidiphilus melanogenes TaxID=411235 RepID=UPI0006937665|nr:HAD-IA family hydrolase [Streptacidiphilus melanogenes]